MPTQRTQRRLDRVGDRGNRVRHDREGEGEEEKPLARRRNGAGRRAVSREATDPFLRGVDDAVADQASLYSGDRVTALDEKR